MFDKKKIMIILFCMLVIVVGVVKINIVNTKALSPKGDADSNYKVVSDEFGSDFQDFIQDKSVLKIYPNKDGRTLIKLYDLEIEIDNDNNIVQWVSNAYNSVEAMSSSILEKEDTVKEEKKNSELDNVVNDYIEYKNNVESEENKEDNNNDTEESSNTEEGVISNDGSTEKEEGNND